MNIQEELWTAIGQHHLWRHRLQHAISTGRSAFVPEAVQDANQCPLGRWLNQISSQHDAPGWIEAVKVRHAEFHRETAEVLELALAGEKSAAQDAMAASGPFVQASDRLTSELLNVCCATKPACGCGTEGWSRSCGRFHGVVASCCEARAHAAAHH
jgi:hypothetical protein